MTRHVNRQYFLLGVIVLALTACSQAERNLYSEPPETLAPLQPESPRPSTTTATAAPTTTVAPTATVPPATDGLPFYVAAEDLPGLSFVAEATVPTVNVYSSDQLVEQTFEFANPNLSGTPLVFLVEDLNDLQAIKVLLPTRPNGSFGWINADQVRLTRHNYSIQVRLDDFAITVTDHEKTIFETTVGVARESTPTPRGRYYTTELLRPPESDTAYGPYAYGLSGYSDTFESFLGGPGQLGIHGTNEPWALGTNVSSGCVRLHNDDITYLVETLQLPLGVPVDII